jgi:hypothetical protein
MPTVTDPLPIPSHRFQDFYKSEHFAFARGLAVSPIHLPLALEAMQEAGWELVAAFGCDADKIGFLFRRIS